MFKQAQKPVPISQLIENKQFNIKNPHTRCPLANMECTDVIHFSPEDKVLDDLIE